MARKTKKSEVATRLAALHEVGLFEKLKLTEAERASASEDQDDALAAAVDHHASNKSYPYLYRAIQNVPADLKVGKVLRVTGLSTLLLESKKRGTIAFTPKTHHQWAAVLDQALEEIGDKRRFIALKIIDWEEPLFLLATPAQAKVVRAVDLEDPYVEDADPETIDTDAALGDIVEILSRKLPRAVTPGASDGAIELVTKVADAGVLVDALYNAHFADLRLTVHTKRRYG